MIFKNLKNKEPKTRELNGAMLQAFEWELPADASHWRRLRASARAFRRMGFTSVWLPPACKGAAGRNDVGYGIYDPYDLGEFDQKGSVPTKYGTAREYRACVAALRRAGLMVLADMVMNHRLGADGKERVRVRPVNPQNRLEFQGEEEEGEVYTRFDFPGRGGRYSRFVWDHRRFTGVDRNERDGAHALFLLEGRNWAPDVDGELGNYDYLMGADVDVRDPEVAEELRRWGRWFLDRTGADGFRLDAVKHISAGFLASWLAALRRETGRELFTVGEYWNADLSALQTFLSRTDSCMSLFDVPLHAHFAEASRSGGAYDMRALLDGTLTRARPELSVTFVDNHDTQPGQSLESWVDGWFKAAAYAFILLGRSGFPCVFWGDLFGIPARGIGAVADLPALLRLRRRNAYGEEHPYLDDSDLAGFTREGADGMPGSGLAFLCTDRAGGEKRMYVGRRFAGGRFRCEIGGMPGVRIDAEGFGVFRVKDGGMAVWAPEEGLAGRAVGFLRRLTSGLGWRYNK